MVPNFQIRDPKLCAYDKATGKAVGQVALPRNSDGSADDPHAEREAIDRRPDRGRQSACGTDRVVPALTEIGLTTLLRANTNSGSMF